MRRCSSCQHENPPDARFCVGCGLVLPSEGGRELDATVQVGVRTCAGCGHPNPGTFRFCTECGHPLEDGSPLRDQRTGDLTIPPKDEAEERPSSSDEPEGDPQRQSDTVRFPSAPDLERAKVTHLVSSDESESHLFLGDFVIGRARGDLQIADDPFLSGEHLAIRRRGGRYALEDLGSTNGTFVRLTREHVLEDGDEVMLGRQLFRFVEGGGGSGGRTGGGQTRVLGFGGAVPRLVRILEGGDTGESYALVRPSTVVGRERGEITFPGDVLLSSVHATIVREQGDGGVIRIRDEGSRNGVFLRIRGEWILDEGDVFTAGRQVFRFEKAEAPPAHGQRTVRLDLDPTPLR